MARIDREILITFGDSYHVMLRHSEIARDAMMDERPSVVFAHAMAAAREAKHVLAMLDRMEGYQYPPILRGEVVKRAASVTHHVTDPQGRKYEAFSEADARYVRDTVGGTIERT